MAPTKALIEAIHSGLFFRAKDHSYAKNADCYGCNIETGFLTSGTGCIDSVYNIPTAFRNNIAAVVEWQTRMLEVHVPQGVRVQVPA